MSDARQPRTTRAVRSVHEIFFSINVGIAIMAALLLYGPRSLLGILIQLEMRVHHLLGMRQSDFVEMHVALFLPALVLGVLVWGGLRSLSNSLASDILRSFAGVLALAITPMWWLGERYAVDRQYGWNPFQALQVYEMIGIIIWVFSFSLGKWPRTFWVNLCIFLAHSGFWIWECGPYHVYISNWQVAPFVGLFSGLAWILYLRKFGVGEPQVAKPLKRV